MDMRADFVRRLRRRQPLVGTFVKSPDPAGVEILAGEGFDFVVLDAEHAPLDRADLARLILAGRAAQVPVVVRIPETAGAWIGTALDAGAAAIMAPQVTGAGVARALVQAMRFGPGGRGFSPSTAAAAFGRRGIADHLARQPQETALICQIEDPAAVQAAGAIAAVPGVDALLVGPVDLAVAAGETDPAAPRVQDLCRAAVLAGIAQGRAAGLFLGDAGQGRDWLAAGASLFLLGSDQAFLRQGAGRALARFRGA